MSNNFEDNIRKGQESYSQKSKSFAKWYGEVIISSLNSRMAQGYRNSDIISCVGMIPDEIRHGVPENKDDIPCGLIWFDSYVQPDLTNRKLHVETRYHNKDHVYDARVYVPTSASATRTHTAITYGSNGL